jgi:hypothetical protein
VVKINTEGGGVVVIKSKKQVQKELHQKELQQKEEDKLFYNNLDLFYNI